MPEGPEVKIASNFLNAYFKDEVITQVVPVSEYFKAKHQSLTNELKEKIIGEKINSFTIGKNTYVPLKENCFYQYHLGMTGYWSNNLTKHSHIKFSSKKTELYFCDIRKFGNHQIINESYINKQQILFDPLSAKYDMHLHYKHLTQRIGQRKNICNALLNQNLFPGVGNYLKSEILYHSEIHPDTMWGQLSTKKIQRLLEMSHLLLNESYQKGGAELKDFKNPFKRSSYRLAVYAKKHDPNGNLVLSTKSKDQRRTWFVPQIQKLQ